MKRSSNIIIVLLLVVVGVLLYKNYAGQKNAKPGESINREQAPVSKSQDVAIGELTREAVVVPYVKQNGRLPDYYITKAKARRGGWDASDGNLCEVLPGKAIGGDLYSNREGSLPTGEGRRWYEADLNYKCGRRNADRLLFSNDGLLFVTYDHYKTFLKR